MFKYMFMYVASSSSSSSTRGTRYVQVCSRQQCLDALTRGHHRASRAGRGLGTTTATTTIRGQPRMLLVYSSAAVGWLHSLLGRCCCRSHCSADLLNALCSPRQLTLICCRHICMITIEGSSSSRAYDF
jgi:hypothetical protein